MKQKIIAVLAFLLTVSLAIGISTAVDTVTLKNMDPDKSIDYRGVMNLEEDNTGAPIKGLCVEKTQTINFGNSVPRTQGTTSINNNNNVKKLITQNYRPGMTKQQGSDLQEAIWYFTEVNYVPSTQNAMDMVNNAIADTSSIPDRDAKVKLSEEKSLKSTTTKEEVIEIGSTSTSTELNKLVDTKTNIEKIVTDTCIKTITTITEYFVKQTTTDTTTFFKKITTQIDVYEVMTSYMTFNFDSVINQNKQDLILFTANQSEETTEETVENPVVEEFSEDSQEITETPFEETTVTEECEKIPEEPTEEPEEPTEEPEEPTEEPEEPTEEPEEPTEEPEEPTKEPEEPTKEPEEPAGEGAEEPEEPTKEPEEPAGEGAEEPEEPTEDSTDASVEDFVQAASTEKTVPMKTTGFPIALLAIAIVSIIGGLGLTRR
jgi:hypothetical protein